MGIHAFFFFGNFFFGGDGDWIGLDWIGLDWIGLSLDKIACGKEIFFGGGMWE